VRWLAQALRGEKGRGYFAGTLGKPTVYAGLAVSKQSYPQSGTQFSWVSAAGFQENFLLLPDLKNGHLLAFPH
jgi:hypothetical protein